MFSGIVEEAAKIVAINKTADGARLSIQSKLDHSATKLGDSIAIDGVCLTVVDIDGASLSFDLATETLRRSTLGDLKAGDSVNLERSIALGDRIHGHLVFGHVDCAAELISITPEGDSTKLSYRIPEEYAAYLATKGSISISGVSLTLGEVGKDEFSVYIIPHTAEVTTLLDRGVGGKSNIEIDMLARYVHAMLSRGEAGSSISKSFLTEHGFIGGADG